MIFRNVEQHLVLVYGAFWIVCAFRTARPVYECNRDITPEKYL
jgi:hypothetical protein